MYSNSTVSQLMYEDELFFENKDEKTNKGEGIIAHYLEQVLNEFNHYLRKRNRYKLSLVLPYVPPVKPAQTELQEAA